MDSKPKKCDRCGSTSEVEYYMRVGEPPAKNICRECLDSYAAMMNTTRTNARDVIKRKTIEWFKEAEGKDVT